MASKHRELPSSYRKYGAKIVPKKVAPESRLTAEEVANLLGITEDEFRTQISIKDIDGDLEIFHYKKKSKMLHDDRIARIRGVVVDTRKGYIVADGGMFTNNAIANGLFVGSDGVLRVKDIFDNTVEIDTKKRYHIAKFETPIYITCFLHNDKFYISSNSKLDITKSRLGDFAPQTFLQMYEEAGGPKRADLYPNSEKESGNVYKFAIINNYINFISITQPEAPSRLQFISCHQQWNAENSPYTVAEIGAELSPLLTNLVEKFPNVEDVIGMDIATANEWLEYGNGPKTKKVYADRRLTNGESVMIRVFDDNGRMTKVLHVKSVAYAAREDLIGNDDMYYSFFHSIGIFNISGKGNDTFDIDAVKKKIPLVRAPPGRDSEMWNIPITEVKVLRDNEIPKDKIDLVSMLAYVYYLYAPSFYKPKAKNLILRYMVDMEDTLNFLTKKSLEKKPDFATAGQAGNACDRILKAAMKKAIFQSRNQSGTTSQGFMHGNIKYLLDREWAESLYNVVKYMRLSEGTNSYKYTDLEVDKQHAKKLKIEKPRVTNPSPSMILSNLNFPSLPSAKIPAFPSTPASAPNATASEATSVISWADLTKMLRS